MMMNVECQSSSFLFDDPSCYLPKMNSSSNLYDYLTNNISIKTLLNNTDDEEDDDRFITTSPITMTSSDSSDSAIVSDEIDDLDLINDNQSKSRNSWLRTIEKDEITSFTSLSQSFNILNQFEQQTVFDKKNNNQQKYKRPLPWSNSTSSISHTSPEVVASNKVSIIYLLNRISLFSYKE
jgi:hypothetical protein